MYYGKQWKINGVVAGPIQSHYGQNGCYTILFEREYASLEDIEGIDWSKVELVRLNAHDCDKGLPEGYGFEVEGISYSHNTRTYTVAVRTASQYLGDVTGYQAQIEELESQVDELTAQGAALAEENVTLTEKNAALTEKATMLDELEEAYDNDN